MSYVSEREKAQHKFAKMAVEDGGGGYAIAWAILEMVEMVDRVADAVHSLGNGVHSDEVGPIAGLTQAIVDYRRQAYDIADFEGSHYGEQLDGIACSVSDIGPAIEHLADAIRENPSIDGELGDLASNVGLVASAISDCFEQKPQPPSARPYRSCD
jgi:hypothetical protein